MGLNTKSGTVRQWLTQLPANANIKIVVVLLSWVSLLFEPHPLHSVQCCGNFHFLDKVNQLFFLHNKLIFYDL